MNQLPCLWQHVDPGTACSLHLSPVRVKAMHGLCRGVEVGVKTDFRGVAGGLGLIGEQERVSASLLTELCSWVRRPGAGNAYRLVSSERLHLTGVGVSSMSESSSTGGVVGDGRGGGKCVSKCLLSRRPCLLSGTHKYSQLPAWGGMAIG